MPVGRAAALPRDDIGREGSGRASMSDRCRGGDGTRRLILKSVPLGTSRHLLGATVNSRIPMGSGPLRARLPTFEPLARHGAAEQEEKSRMAYRT